MKESTTALNVTMDTHGLMENAQNVLKPSLDAKSVTSTALAEDAMKTPSFLSTELNARSNLTTAEMELPWSM